MAERLRVLHLITGLDAGGAEVMLQRLVCAMDPSQFENSVVSMTGGGVIAERLVSAGVDVSHLGMRPGIPNPAGLARWRAVLRRKRPDLVQCWMYHANLLASLARRDLADCPLVWGLHHSNLSWSVNKAQTLMIARLCAVLSRRVPEAIVCCSEAARRAHESIGYESRRLVVISNGIDTDLFRPEPASAVVLRRELGIPLESPVIALIARFHPQKNHRGFIEAASRLGRARPDVYFVLCGAGIVGNPLLAGWMHDAGMAQRFRLLPPRDDVQRIMAGSTLLASSSAGEGMSNVIGEAMACGTVCVVTDVGDSARVVGDTGVTVRPDDPEALTNGLLAALKLSPNALREMGAAARRRVQDHFDLSRTVRAYEALYQQTIKIPAMAGAFRRAS